MSDPNGKKFSFPQTNVVVREDGDVVVEMSRNSEPVGELNVSAMIKTFLHAFGFAKLPKKAPE